MKSSLLILQEAPALQKVPQREMGENLEEPSVRTEPDT